MDNKDHVKSPAGELYEPQSDARHVEAADSKMKSTSNKSTSDKDVVNDPIFGEISEDGPNFRNVGWVRTGILMCKTQVGIGVLSIPSAFALVGLVPGVIILLVVAVMTTWSDMMIGAFKLRHPEVYGLDDVGGLMFGRVGREVFTVAFQLYWMFVTGSAIVTVSTALNAVSHHATCTDVFVAVSAILTFGLSSVRTFSRISWAAWVGMACILTAVFTVTIATAVQDRPAAAPQNGPWTSDYLVIGNPTFAQAMVSVSSCIFAYSGTPAFFAIISEMKEPKLYGRSVLLCQSVVTVTYLIVGIVVYRYTGTYVSSPALGSAGPIIKVVAYAIALPGLLVSSLIVAHIPAKSLFVRILRGSKHLVANSRIHWTTWIGCTFAVSLVGYIIASAIPAFSALVSLIGALFGTGISITPYGAMWLYDHYKAPAGQRGAGWIFGVCWAVFMTVAGFFCMAGGTYGSVLDIITIYKQSPGSAAWSCADNSGS